MVAWSMKAIGLMVSLNKFVVTVLSHFNGRLKTLQLIKGETYESHFQLYLLANNSQLTYADWLSAMHVVGQRPS